MFWTRGRNQFTKRRVEVSSPRLLYSTARSKDHIHRGVETSEARKEETNYRQEESPEALPALSCLRYQYLQDGESDEIENKRPPEEQKQVADLNREKMKKPTKKQYSNVFIMAEKSCVYGSSSADPPRSTGQHTHTRPGSGGSTAGESLVPATTQGVEPRSLDQQELEPYIHLLVSSLVSRLCIFLF